MNGSEPKFNTNGHILPLCCSLLPYIWRRATLTRSLSLWKQKKDKQHSQLRKLKTVGVWLPKDYEKSLGFYINKLASDLGARWWVKRRASTSRFERKENPLLIPLLLSPKGTTLRTPEKRERGTEVPTVVGWGQWEIREARTTPKFPQLPSGVPIVSIHLQTPGDSEGDEKKVVWASGNLALAPPHQLYTGSSSYWRPPAQPPWAGCHCPFNKGCSPGTPDA